ncbi:hypothetical protein AB0F96_12020 [Streptomyces sp. NPDC023998]|uniref:hypothetical protein n=1 Tax=Streptomyces sp. NPDC023998 TaxID=3154597 RepID=UPI0034056B29
MNDGSGDERFTAQADGSAARVGGAPLPAPGDGSVPLPAQGRSGGEPLTAQWAVLGKYPGQTMGYEVLGSSPPERRAGNFLWGAAAVGAPDDRDGRGALPWRVFLSGVEGETAACAVVETVWDGSRDGTGAPSYAWRLILLEWSSASAAGLTWTALNRAVAAVQWPTLTAQSHPATGAAVAIDVPRTAAAEPADTVDRLGFEWAAGVAALLLDGQQVAIVPPQGAGLPDTDERVRILDAVCSLLPYGCRVWLNAATWTGQSDHELMLVFTPAARGRQQEVCLDGGVPPQPQSPTACSYLVELLRLREKPKTTVELVAHLLGATTAIPFRERDEAVRVLKEMDLLDSEIEEIRQGRGQLRNVRRVLEMHSSTALGEHRLAVLVVFLARTASTTSPARQQATEILLRYWSPLTPRLLAEDILAVPASQTTFIHARQYLELLREVGAQQPGAFDELFVNLVGAPNQDPQWVAELIQMAERNFGPTTEAAHRILIGSREVGLAWLRLLLERKNPDLSALFRLVPSALRQGVGTAPGWLRFASVLTGDLAPDDVAESDAAEFTEVHSTAWRTALEAADASRRPALISLLWPSLLQAARGPDWRELLTLLDRVAPPGQPGLAPSVAADADLLRAVAGYSSGAGLELSMPRLREFTDPEQLGDCASALDRRVDFDLGPVMTEALLGDEPHDNCWAVLTQLMRQHPSLELPVRDGLARRLSADYSRWLQLRLSDDLVNALSHRGNLGWLHSVVALRNIVRDGGSTGQVAQVVANACPSLSFSRQMAGEIIEWLGEQPPAVAYELARALDHRLRGLGKKLHAAIRLDERAGALRETLMRFLESEEDCVRGYRAALSGLPPVAPGQPWSPSPPTGVYGGSGSHGGSGSGSYGSSGSGYFGNYTSQDGRRTPPAQPYPPQPQLPPTSAPQPEYDTSPTYDPLQDYGGTPSTGIPLTAPGAPSAGHDPPTQEQPPPREHRPTEKKKRGRLLGRGRREP